MKIVSARWLTKAGDLAGTVIAQQDSNSVECKYEKYAELVAGLTKELFVNVYDGISLFE